MLTQTLSKSTWSIRTLSLSAPRAWRPSRRLLKILLDSDACFIDASLISPVGVSLKALLLEVF